MKKGDTPTLVGFSFPLRTNGEVKPGCIRAPARDDSCPGVVGLPQAEAFPTLAS